MNLLIVSCSLSPTSHSALMAKHLAENCRDSWENVEYIDLRRLPLPFCDGQNTSHDLQVEKVTAQIHKASAVALAMPIYNYDVGGNARNLIALTGSAWNEKVVGLIAAAGGKSSYMAPMSIANSLMLDFRCVIVPRFVYAAQSSFHDGELRDDIVKQRLTELGIDLHHFAVALAN